MNKTFIIGNLTHSPELKTVSGGISVCTFTVAVNKRNRARTAGASPSRTAHEIAGGQEPEADFFRVTAWRQLGENCAKYLDKGRKVAVTGAISTRAYQGKDGSPRASLELTADDVEFLSPKGEQTTEANAVTSQPAAPSGFADVTGEDELPF